VNHETQQSVGLIQFKKECNVPTISWTEAVDEALCFGWIDSTRRTVDHQRFLQLFTRRKPKSVWSKINKEKVQRLTEQQLMAPAGLAAVAVAKQNGSWEILNEVETLEIPKDLEAGLNSLPGAMLFFSGLSKSVRKAILQWLVLAKRTETRQKRIREIAELAAQGLKPKQFR
jgi:uncharacterized protein YdeI (YjbR/CyaY-like superfamily)